MDILISWFDHMRDVVPKMEATTWAEFADRLGKLAKIERGADQKANTPLVSPAVYAEGGRRNNQDVIGFGRWFAIDIDKGACSLQAASDLCRNAKVSHVIWTTTNHTDDMPRFRIAFPLDRDVEREEMALFWRGAHIWFKEWGDVSTKDPSRMMIAPANWLGTNPQFIRVDGLGCMSVDRLLALATAMPTQVAATTTSPKRPIPVTGGRTASPERARAQSAISKWKLGALTKADLHGVQAEHLMPQSSKAHRHGRGGDKMAAAKKTLERMQRAAK